MFSQVYSIFAWIFHSCAVADHLTVVQSNQMMLCMATACDINNNLAGDVSDVTLFNISYTNGCLMPV